MAARTRSVTVHAPTFSAGTPLNRRRTTAAPTHPAQRTTVTASAATSVPRNANIGKLAAGYLFPEIARLRNAHLEKNPDAKLISLGIGDTTEPIPEVIAKAMADAAMGLATLEGYSGYGAEQGNAPLREGISSHFYQGRVKATEVFVSDGAKCDIARLQMMFGQGLTAAVQDPSYPAYVDTTVLMGNTGTYQESNSQYQNISYLPCSKDNDFFPDLSGKDRVDVIFFCSPNNPTGAAATRSQLEELVEYCRKNGTILVYDAAYASYIADAETYPRSIYDIDGAEEVAIEVNSFSKYAGFTGVRLGWTVVPEALKYADGSPVAKDFNRVMCTCFNGASNVVQAGGLACLTAEGIQAMSDTVDFYKENAQILKTTFQDLGFEVYGGENAPYVWLSFPGRKSWDVFSEILEKTDIVVTPGSGFGPAGEGYVRASAFGHRENILEATERFRKLFG